MIYVSCFFPLPLSLANFVSIIYCGKAMPKKQSLHIVLKLIFILNCYRSEHIEPMSVENLHTSHSSPYQWCLPSLDVFLMDVFLMDTLNCTENLW